MSINGRTRIAFVLAAAIACAGAAAADDIPRTPGGKPDFSGNYDIATLTPVQRSPELGNRLTLTAEEARAIRNREARPATRGTTRPGIPCGARALKRGKSKHKRAASEFRLNYRTHNRGEACACPKSNPPAQGATIR